MKKLTIILLLTAVGFLTSCKENFRVENPKKETTLEIQNLIDTTQTFFVVEKSEYLYVLDQNREVVYKASTKEVIGALLGGVFIGVIIGLAIAFLT